MKTCPNCKELVGDNVSKCFNCGWNFDDPSENEKAIRKKMEQTGEAEKKELERRLELSKINNKYEYTVIRIRDNADGTCDEEKIKRNINYYAMEGWRLHTIYSNELGKNSSSVGIVGISGQVNATICETIIVMERLISSVSNE